MINYPNNLRSYSLLRIAFPVPYRPTVRIGQRYLKYTVARLAHVFYDCHSYAVPLLQIPSFIISLFFTTK